MNSNSLTKSTAPLRKNCTLLRGESHMQTNRIVTTALFFLALTATPAMAQHTVALSWTASTTSGVTYNVYREQACSGNFTQINASAVATATYTDAAVAPGETYCYKVT